MAEKRYYWIRLKTDFFATDGPMDLLMSQPNGAEYVVLYQMLCLQTANTAGRLAAKVGDFLMPFDVKKIARDCKYFDTDTITVALSLFRRLGLIYEETDGIIALADYDEMIGSESGSAERVRRLRERKKQARLDAAPEALPEASDTLHCNECNGYNVTVEIRDKSIEDNCGGYTGDRGPEEGAAAEPPAHAPKPQKRFTPPTLDEVIDYCEQRKNHVDPERFWNHYERVGWKVGRSPMKDWRAAVRYWERDETPRTSSAKPEQPGVHFALEKGAAPEAAPGVFDDIFQEASS